jgi:hypothetical protein
MIGDVDVPHMSALARQADVLDGIVLWAGFDDDGSAVFSGSKMIEIACVQKALDDLGVAIFGDVLGHQAAAAAGAGCRR